MINHIRADGRTSHTVHAIRVASYRSCTKDKYVICYDGISIDVINVSGWAFSFGDYWISSFGENLRVGIRLGNETEGGWLPTISFPLIRACRQIPMIRSPVITAYYKCIDININTISLFKIEE